LEGTILTARIQVIESALAAADEVGLKAEIVAAASSGMAVDETIPSHTKPHI